MKLIRKTLLGLYFFENNVTGAEYLNLLQNELSEMLEDIYRNQYL